MYLPYKIKSTVIGGHTAHAQRHNTYSQAAQSDARWPRLDCQSTKKIGIISATKLDQFVGYVPIIESYFQLPLPVVFTGIPIDGSLNMASFCIC